MGAPIWGPYGDPYGSPYGDDMATIWDQPCGRFHMGNHRVVIWRGYGRNHMGCVIWERQYGDNVGGISGGAGDTRQALSCLSQLFILLKQNTGARGIHIPHCPNNTTKSLSLLERMCLLLVLRQPSLPRTLLQRQPSPPPLYFKDSPHRPHSTSKTALTAPTLLQRQPSPPPLYFKDSPHRPHSTSKTALTAPTSVLAAGTS